MALTIGEKIGAIAAFIPGVSIVSGLIKAWVYYNRSKGSSGDREKMIDTAQQAQEVAAETFVDLDPSLNKCNNKLWKASIAEMIPGINLIAAIYSIVVLRKLSQTREIRLDPLKLRDYLFKEYGRELFKDERKNVLMYDVLKLLQKDKILTPERKKELAAYCYGVIGGRYNSYLDFFTASPSFTDCAANRLLTFAQQELRELNQVPTSPTKTVEEIRNNLQNNIRIPIDISELD